MIVDHAELERLCRSAVHASSPEYQTRLHIVEMPGTQPGVASCLPDAWIEHGYTPPFFEGT